jgi:hypothetical protein
MDQGDQTAMRSTDFDVNFIEPDLPLVPPSIAPVLLSTLQSASLNASGRETRSAIYLTPEHHYQVPAAAMQAAGPRLLTHLCRHALRPQSLPTNSQALPKAPAPYAPLQQLLGYASC